MHPQSSIFCSITVKTLNEKLLTFTCFNDAVQSFLASVHNDTNVDAISEDAFTGRFVRECTDFSYVAGEGVELTVHKESVVVEEIKEVELMRSHPGQFIYDRSHNRIGLQPWGNAPS